MYYKRKTLTRCKTQRDNDSYQCVVNLYLWTLERVYIYIYIK